MNDKRAKRLRRVAHDLAKEMLPKVVYTTINRRKMIIVDGEQHNTLVPQIILGQCERKIYKEMKKLYNEATYS